MRRWLAWGLAIGWGAAATAAAETEPRSVATPAAVLPIAPRPVLALDHKRRAAWQRYQRYLSKQGLLASVAPEQMLRAAFADPACAEHAYEVPPRRLWARMVPTLRLLRELHHRRLLPEHEITSAFRSVVANTCARGARGSKHMKNAALDLELRGDAGALCEFWRKHGKRWRFGLGFYDDRHIHIDTLGHRTWGLDFTHKTSLCLASP